MLRSIIRMNTLVLPIRSRHFACMCVLPRTLAPTLLRDLRGRGGQLVSGPLFSRVRAPQVAHSDIVGSEFGSPRFRAGSSD
jgi:hypothetical protein